jgi:transcription initiation factor TFIID subunit 3
MSSVNLHNALLRPAVLQILRAAGFTYTRNAVLDTVTDLAARYLLLLASATAQHAFNNHNDYVPTVQDVRLALLDVGAFRPQLSVLEEKAKGMEEINGETVPFEDMRGVDGFVNWARGPANKEIRRITGLLGEAGTSDGLAVLDEEEDYVTGESIWLKLAQLVLTFTALKKKHSKTGEESRYQGSVLGKDADGQNVVVAGGPFASISEWGAQVRSHAVGPVQRTPASSGISSAPLTPMEEDGDVADEA